MSNFAVDSKRAQKPPETFAIPGRKNPAPVEAVDEDEGVVDLRLRCGLLSQSHGSAYIEHQGETSLHALTTFDLTGKNVLFMLLLL